MRTRRAAGVCSERTARCEKRAGGDGWLVRVRRRGADEGRGWGPTTSQTARFQIATALFFLFRLGLLLHVALG